MATGLLPLVGACGGRKQWKTDDGTDAAGERFERIPSRRILLLLAHPLISSCEVLPDYQTGMAVVKKHTPFVKERTPSRCLGAYP